jgi:hypothetical protein
VSLPPSRQRRLFYPLLLCSGRMRMRVRSGSMLTKAPLSNSLASRLRASTTCLPMRSKVRLSDLICTTLGLSPWVTARIAPKSRSLVAGQVVPGTGVTWDYHDGVLLRQESQIVVAEFALDLRTEKPVRTPDARAKAIVRHEYGHAIDLIHGFSRSDVFLRA